MCDPGKKSKAGIIVLSVLALAILILVVVLIVILSTDGDLEEQDKKSDDKKTEVKSTYMDPVNDFLKLINKKDVDAIALENVLMPKFAAKKYNKIIDYFESTEEFQERLEMQNEKLRDIYEGCEEKFGDWEIVFEEKIYRNSWI